MAELMHYSITFVKSIVDLNWMIAALSVVAEILYSIDVSVLDRWCCCG